MRERRRRELSAEERALWDKVARSADALRPDDAPPTEASPLSADVAGAPAAKPVAVNVGAMLELTRTVPPPREKRGPSLTPIDRRTRSKVARGSLPLDGRLDLHGMTQAEAHDRLAGFLRGIQAGGGRLVLVITGKGRIGDDPLDSALIMRGALRRAVPHWLASPEFRVLVAGFETAHRTHGGEGAIYVRLRQRRPR